MFSVTPKIRSFLAAALVGSLSSMGAAFSQEESASSLSLELNGAQPSQKGCRFTFVVANRLGTDLSKAAFEIALFDDKGVVQTLTVLDFQELPAGKTKVSRFDLPGVDCTKVGRVLVNHATECAGTGLAPTACMRSLKPASKSGIEFGV